MINSQTMRELRRARRELDRIIGAQDQRALSAWLDMWRTQRPAIIAALAEGNDQVRAARVARTLQAMGEAVAGLTDAFSLAVKADLGTLLSASVVASQRLIASQLPKGMSDQFAGIRDRQLQAMLDRTTQTITSRMQPLAAEAQERMRDALLHGVAQGLNPTQVAKGMASEFDLSLSRAMVISRTEQLDAYRAAGAATHQANEKVLRGWEWVAQLRERTCPSCIAMNGREFPLSEPGPFDHPQGRCARVPVTKTFRELGIDFDEPETYANPNGEQWFNSQSAATQESILGPKRYAAWKDGRYPIEKWSVRKENKGWRDSHVVGPL